MNQIKNLSNEELMELYNMIKEYIDYLNSQKEKLEEANEGKSRKTDK